MLKDKIIDIIAEVLGIEKEQISETTKIAEDLGADSLDLFQIIMSLEEEYNIEIPTEDASEIETVADIEQYMQTKLGQ